MATRSLRSSASVGPEGIDWRTFNHRSFVMRTLSENDARLFASELGLMPSKPDSCINCGASASSVRLAHNGDLFTCRVCQASFSVKRDTYFEGSHLSTTQLLEHLYFSCTHIYQYELMHGSKSTVTKWSSSLRAIPSLILAC
jgi:hypothetical protein